MLEDIVMEYKVFSMSYSDILKLIVIPIVVNVYVISMRFFLL